MGCGTSKNDVIKSASSASDGPMDKKKCGNIKDDLKKSKDSLNSVLSEGSTIPAHDMYQNGGNNNGGPLNNKGQGLKSLPPLKPVRSSKVGQGENGPRPEPIAFEVPAEDGESDGSLIKKHPPRRLRQLEDKPPELPNLTHEEIEEKVALANQRRNQVLTQRVASARQKSARGGRMRKPGPTMDSEQYNMAEYENEIEGGRNSPMGGGDFM